ncbi:galactose-1-phosphate uridyl transferase [Polyrhizophydium stewartii]|uniref:Galactose-1-phosphate uridylyltransferase n=1 Tax=Polyrhizophydium stewartii TaxID=2732419 RepID=A0ABR4NC41_9FUNG
MADAFEFSDHSHRRRNPLTNSWVLCSPHRAKRPWLGQQEKTSEGDKPAYLPDCYLCPRNPRVTGSANPDYTSTYVFPNDFPAFHKQQPAYTPEALHAHASSSTTSSGAGDATNGRLDSIMTDLFQVEGVRGESRVVCFSPNHSETLAEMSTDAIVHVVRTWIDQCKELATQPHVANVQIFENKGAAMGCSNPHPHCQIWATDDIPQEPAAELSSFAAYKTKRGTCLMCDYAALERTLTQRLVCENDSFICVVPFWAVWPFETMIVAKQHTSAMAKLSDKQVHDLADILRRITCRYDNLFTTSFPYSMGIHQAPIGPAAAGNPDAHAEDSDLMHLHLHFYPPLLRSATVRKFLVGFEMLGEAQRDLTAEQAAERLRACSETHYSKQ